MSFLKFILIFIFIVPSFSYSQNFEKIAKVVDLYPLGFSKIDDLVLKIKTDFLDQSDKARATFYWICKNISYDVDFSKKLEVQQINAFSYKTKLEFEQKNKKFNTDLAISTFRYRKAVCYGYAALFNEISLRLGIECDIIRGNLKSNPSQIGLQFDTNHGWNAVKINNQWKLVDCTLASGHLSSKTGEFVYDFKDVYFFTDYKLFYLNHYPDDIKWLLSNKMSFIEYTNLPIYFVDFLSLSTDIKLPEKGVFKDNEEFIINLNDFNFEDNYLDYMFSDDDKRTYIDLDLKPNNFKIQLNGKASKFLYLFLNRKLLVAYKISN